MRERRPLIRFKDFKPSDLDAIRAENKKGGVKEDSLTKKVEQNPQKRLSRMLPRARNI